MGRGAEEVGGANDGIGAAAYDDGANGADDRACGGMYAAPPWKGGKCGVACSR